MKNVSHQTIRIMSAISIFPLFFYALPAFAGEISGLNAENMLINFFSNIPNLMRLATALAYVMGMMSIVKGIMELKHLGESRTMMSREHTFKTPLMYIAIGAALLYLPTTVNALLSTFWTQPCPYCYYIYEVNNAESINDVVMIIQLVGVIAIIRGLNTLSQSASSHGSPEKVSKGLVHIIGGALCINIYQFVNVILLTFGLTIGT